MVFVLVMKHGRALWNSNYGVLIEGYEESSASSVWWLLSGVVPVECRLVWWLKVVVDECLGVVSMVTGVSCDLVDVGVVECI